MALGGRFRDNEQIAKKHLMSEICQTCSPTPNASLSHYPWISSLETPEVVLVNRLLPRDSRPLSLHKKDKKKEQMQGIVAFDQIKVADEKSFWM